MNKINILSEEVISKIAAGEIIERPASIVKELLENSIDSGADNIILEIENGGKRKIKVIDNGCGMNKNDASICIERHATSKIKNMDDLKKISSLGFRGEALASISAVSGDLEIITKDKNCNFGTSVKVSGQKKSVSEAGASLGTTVIIKDLFLNVPARLKFLKSTFTELGHISEIVFKESLVYQDISFKLIHNNQLIYNVLKEDNLKNRIILYYGKEIDKELITIISEQQADDFIKISGIISKPSYTKPNRSYQSIFVNKRPVFDRIIANAISSAYDTLLSKDRFPLVVLFIDINPELVDVNVHPTKKEVRFAKANEIHKNVVNTIRQTLEKNNIIKKHTSAFIEGAVARYAEGIPALNQSNYDTGITSRASEVKEAIQEYLTPANLAETLDKKQLLQINNTFIILETEQDEKGIYIIDQHAAHERIIYEDIISKKSSLLESQGLLLPVNLNLTAKESNALEENINFFEEAGFEIANLGKFTFSILAVPEILAEKDFSNTVKDILSDLSNEKLSNKIAAKDKIIKTIACRSAVMANDKLEFEQMEFIANKIEKCKLPYCPHGRPAIVFLSISEINKMFKRTTMSLRV